MIRINERISERQAFVSALAAGFLTHSFAFYNKLSYLDDCTHYFDLGFTYSSGRWGLGLIKALRDWLDLPSVSMSFFNGFLAIIWLACIAALVVHMLKIQRKSYAVLIGIYMAVFPAVTSTFAYMFTAPYYFFAALLMVLAVYFVHRSRAGIIPAMLFIAFAMGIYQAYIGLATSLFVLVLLAEAGTHSFYENIRCAVRCFIGLVLGIILYFGLNSFFISTMHIELNSYQGISDMGKITVSGLLQGVVKAYKIWPQLTRWSFAGISDTGVIRMLYAGCLILFVLFSLIYIRRMLRKKEWRNLLYVVFLLAMVPLSIGIIFVMTASSDTSVHTLMLYNFAVIPIYPLVLGQAAEGENTRRVSENKNWLKKTAVFVLCMMILYYVWLDNMAYAKANYQQEAAIAYYTVMLSEIKGTEGYSDELPVIFLGNLDGQDRSLYNPAEFEKVNLQGYHANMNEFISYFAKADIFMPIHMGYRFDDPKEPERIYESEYVKKMPCYPEKGAIQVVDGVVVVKLSKKYGCKEDENR